jgi:hypothetical protein
LSQYYPVGIGEQVAVEIELFSKSSVRRERVL